MDSAARMKIRAIARKIAQEHAARIPAAMVRASLSAMNSSTAARTIVVAPATVVTSCATSANTTIARARMIAASVRNPLREPFPSTNTLP